jgi:hypothetical protein
MLKGTNAVAVFEVLLKILQTLSRVVKICVQSQWAKTKIEN